MNDLCVNTHRIGLSAKTMFLRYNLRNVLNNDWYHLISFVILRDFKVNDFGLCHDYCYHCFFEWHQNYLP